MPDPPKIWRQRRIVLLDPAGSEIKRMDVSGIPNANSQATLVITIDTQCDLGHWHRNQIIEISPWGAD